MFVLGEWTKEEENEGLQDTFTVGHDIPSKTLILIKWMMDVVRSRDGR